MGAFGVFSEPAWGLLALGVAAGMLSAMLGVGSGVLLVPALVLVAGLSQKSAQGTALAVMVPMALVGAALYLANPEIDISLGRVAWLSIGAVGGAFIGVFVAGLLPGVVLRRLFAGLLVIVALRMMWASGERRKEARPDRPHHAAPARMQDQEADDAP